MAWITLMLLSSANLLNYMDRVLISVLAAQIKMEFHLSDTEYGLLTGLAFVSVYSFVSIFFGWLADRKPRHAVLAAGLSVWSAATMLCGMATNYAWLAFARAGVGIGEAAFVPAAYSLLSEKFRPEHRATAVTVLNTVGMIGILLSFLIGGWIGVHWGWRCSFMICGIPGITLAVLILFLIPDLRASRAKVVNERALGFTRSLMPLWLNRPYVWLILGGGLSTFANIGVIQWLPLFFSRSHHLSLPQISLFFGPLLTAGMILGLVGGGYIANRLVRTSLWKPLTICVWVNVAIPPVFWLTLLIPSAGVALGMTFVTGFLGVAHTPTYAAAIQNCCQAELRGSASAFMVLINSIFGMGLLPFLVGILSDAAAPLFGENSLRYALATVISSNLIAAFAFWRAYESFRLGASDVVAS